MIAFLQENGRFMLNIAMGFTCMWIMLCTMLERRKHLWIAIVFSSVKSFYAQFLTTAILANMGSESAAGMYLQLANAIALPLADAVMLCCFFKAEPPKVLIAAIISEMVGGGAIASIAVMIVNLIEGRSNPVMGQADLQWADLLLIPVCAAVFAAFYLPTRSLLLKYRSFEIRHKKIFSVLFIVFLWSTSWSYFVSMIDKRQMSAAYMFAFMVHLLLILSIGYLLIRYQRRKIKEESEYLLHQQELIETHAIVLKQNTLDECQRVLEEQMRELAALEQGHRLIQSDRLQRYLSELKQQYENLRAGAFCRDALVDAILYYQSERMEKQGLILECSCHGYDAGKIEQTDLAQLLFRLLETVCQEKNRQTCIAQEPVRLTLTSLGQQLLIALSWQQEQKKKLHKPRWLRSYLKKYDGTMRMEENDGRTELQIGLMK
ncbi:MAG: hypothetical protein Q4B57_01125 [Eubacteriales bacterium]|nr:hypothetical protein [Eubacteriales bacterium]